MSLVAARTLRADAGRVLRVPVEVGDRVEPGQMLAEMDPIDLDERLRAECAALARLRLHGNTRLLATHHSIVLSR